MDLQFCYNQLGGNYSEVKGRLMSDALIERFLLKFPNDPTMQQLRDAVAAGDVTVSFRAAHTLKGVAANLSLTSLQKTASALTDQLRDGEQPADSTLYEAVENAYQKTIETISEYMAQK